MLLQKLSVQTREIEQFNSAKLADLQAQLTATQRSLEEVRWESSRQMEQMEHDHEEAILTAVREALEPVDSELEALRKDREAYLLLQKDYQDLQARIEPFRVSLKSHFFRQLFITYSSFHRNNWTCSKLRRRLFLVRPCLPKTRWLR